MVLLNAQKGNSHRIVSIDAEDALVGKLAALGFVPGAKINVLRNSLFGSAIVSCKGAQFALGRGLAERIQLDD